MRLLFWSPRSRTACRDECLLTQRGNLSFHGRPLLAITPPSHGKLQAGYPFPPAWLSPDGSRPAQSLAAGAGADAFAGSGTGVGVGRGGRSDARRWNIG